MQAGDKVGVFLSFETDANGVPASHLQLNNIPVVAVQGAPAPAVEDETASTDAVTATSPGSEPVAVDNLMVTLALPAADAEQLVFGAEFGTLWLSAQPEGTPTEGTRVVGPPQAYEPERGQP